jgi:hypothetical protein
VKQHGGYGQRETRVIKALFGIQRGLCFWCGGEMLRGRAQQRDRRRGWSREHIVPRRQAPRGGLHGNTVLAHPACNTARGDRPPSLADVARGLDIQAQLDKSITAQRPSLQSEFNRPDPAPGLSPGGATGPQFATLAEVWPHMSER